MVSVNDNSFIMAERLKKLRESKGLSHERLSTAIREQYGVNISRDSLINYEVSTADHTKAYKNQGMSVKNLQCLACFYNVSTEYLLGYTKDPQRISSVADEMGISSKAIEMLRNSQALPFGDRYIPGLNLLLENPSFYSTLRKIADLADFVTHVKGADSYSFLSNEDKRINKDLSPSPLEERRWNDGLAAVALAKTITSEFPELQGKLTVLCGVDNIEYLVNKIAQDFRSDVEVSVRFLEWQTKLIMTKERDPNGHD